MIPCYLVPWFLLIIGSIVVLGNLYRLIHEADNFRILPDTAGGVFMAIGALFAWLGPAMIVANLLVAAVPRARRALDREAKGVPGTDRGTANRNLLKMSYYLTPAGMLIALIGLLVLW